MAGELTNLKEFSVSELSGVLKKYVEEGFSFIKVRGELGRVSRPTSGHIYFDLKDERSVLAGVVWRTTTIQPEYIKEGLEVIAVGKLTTFSGQSRYQLIVTNISPAGAGALMAMLKKRKEEFLKEGLFDKDKKKPLPFLPEVIGVVTSENGAVFRDILHRLHERFPRHVIIWSVPVQGHGSAEKIAEAIIGFNLLAGTKTCPKPDVLIVGRGGGSLEDLWCFNEEVVVRAVANSEIPIISAVGHETDTNLIDYVADVRAPTPTAAAEYAVPEIKKLLEKIDDFGTRLLRPVLLKLEQEKRSMFHIKKSMENVKYILAGYVQRFDILVIRFPNILENYLQKKREKLLQIKTSVLDRDFIEKDIQIKSRLVYDLGKALNRHVTNAYLNKKSILFSHSRLHNSLNYKRTLSRGYAIVRDKDMRLVRDKAQATKEKDLRVEFEDGFVAVKVQDSGLQS